MSAVDPFSSHYAQARQRFLQAATAAGAQQRAWRHPLPGRDGEVLALDLALCGQPDAQRLLIVSSACHGVEGYCGSGVQVAALRDARWQQAHADAGVAVLYLHGVNPYGFSHLRRVTHENVDLNRNFQDFAQPLPANPAYGELHPWLLPEQWPPTAENEGAIHRYLAQHGMAALQTAVSGGQYSHPDGLFFGGHAPAWSNLVFRQALREHAGQARHIGWIDLHSGLGPSGHGERAYAGAGADHAAWARTKAWWSGGGATPVLRLDDGSSVSAPLTGLMWTAVFNECPQAEVTAIGIEFGTQPLMQVLQALRAEQWLQLHPQAPAAQAAQIKADLLAAFYVDTPEWKQAVLTQAQQAMQQAVAGLAQAAT